MSRCLSSSCRCRSRAASLAISAISLAALGGCLFAKGSVALPTNGTVVHDQLVFHSDFDLRQKPLLKELAAQRKQLAQCLALPVSKEPIHVYLFDSPEQYRSYIERHYPGFPERRAFFVENGANLAVYAQWGDRVDEDLRHEVAHGYLHAMLPEIPLWIDEGVAEYFETEPADRGNHPSHVALLTGLHHDGQWTPTLSHLDELTEPGDMQQEEYAESWAWIAWLLDSTPERRKLLQDYFADLHQRQPEAATLAERIREAEPNPELALLNYLATLNQR